jgi:hypothetical protein
MHRSGTTLLSQLLNQAGIFQGVFRDHNSEAFHFLSINQQTLEKVGCDWLNPIEVKSKDWFSISAEELYAIHFQVSPNSLKLKWLHNHAWGWKDPRNTFTLPMYLSLFPKARVINVLRDGRDVALSLKQRNKVAGEVHSEKLDDLEFNFRLWEKYVKKGTSYKDSVQQFIQVKYEDLLEGKKETISLLERFCNVNLRQHLGVIRKPKSREYSNEIQMIASKSESYNKWYAI